MPTIILSYTLYTSKEKRTGVIKLRHCETDKEAKTRLKDQLKQLHKDFIKVEF